MSILLESLNDSKNTPTGDIPSLDDSHFNDEMLSDEWLLKKLKFWKVTSAILAIIVFVLVVLLTGYLSNSITDPDVDIQHFNMVVKEEVEKLRQQELRDSQGLATKQTQEYSSVRRTTANVNNSSNSNSNSKLAGNEESNNKVDEGLNNEASNKQGSNGKELYQPQKRNLSVAKMPQSQSSIPTESHKNYNVSQILNYESLSEEQQTAMPDLEISSYAISDNVAKSFVVLNGSFYGQGETIAPDLTLISIKKEGIVVRYKGQLIRKKYSL